MVVLVADAVFDVVAYKAPHRFAIGVRKSHVAGERAITDGWCVPAPVQEWLSDER